MMLDFTSILATLFLSALLLLTLHHFKTKPHLHHLPTPTALPVIGHLHLLGPLIHQSLHHLSSCHGPLFRLSLGSVPCVVASTPDLAKEFLKANEHLFSTRKKSVSIDLLTYDAAFAFAPPGPYWKFIKKICMNELVGSRTLNKFLPIRTEETRCFLKFLASKAKANEEVNVTEELVKLANNIISQMMISMRCSGTKGEADEARTLVREVTKIFGEFNISDFVKFLKSWDMQGVRKRSEDIHVRYDALLEKIIKDREEIRKQKKLEKTHDGERVMDFLDLMLDVMEDKDSEVKVTKDNIKALILDFFTAGTDTTATGIEWALAELINNPKVLKKAQEEIERVVGNDRLAAESDGPNLPYIQAIVKETLRLHPPIPMIIRKSTQECMIEGYKIPANALLIVNIWSIGRNPKYWESPTAFRPERFLGAENSGLIDFIDVKGQHFQLLPFGSGRRGCPGMALAMLELPTVLTALIQCFDWKDATRGGQKVNGDGAVDMTERPGLTAPRAHDLVCVPIARTDQLDILLNP